MDMNTYIKLKNISNHQNNIALISKELKPDGLIEEFKDIFEKEIDPPNADLIISSNNNTLKKFNLVLNKYSEWISSFRKIHHEC